MQLPLSSAKPLGCIPGLQVGLRSLVEAVEAAGYKAEPESWDLSGSSATKSGLSEASKW